MSQLGLRRLAAAVVLLAAGCGCLYTASPRYSRGKAEPREREMRKPVPVRDARQGRLGWPVVGRVTETFGVKVNPKYGTKTKSLGIDIACAKGSPVKAVFGGKVSFADRFMGYGKMVIVDHGNRLHSICSRLEEIRVSVGDQVAKGAIIAFARDTLHLEVRKQGKSVDPEQWLVPR